MKLSARAARSSARSSKVSGAKVDINDDGIIKIASPNGDAIKKAYEMIHSIVAEPEEGVIYTGTVVKIVDFGAFVNFFGKRDGLVQCQPDRKPPPEPPFGRSEGRPGS